MTKTDDVDNAPNSPANRVSGVSREKRGTNTPPPDATGVDDAWMLVEGEGDVRLVGEAGAFEDDLGTEFWHQRFTPGDMHSA
jgi:hypothetical protein